MIDLDTHEVKKRINYPTDDEEWYEIKYLPFQKEHDFDTDLEFFLAVVVNWGGVKLKGKDFECTDKNKKLFYWNAKDRVKWIFFCSQAESLFGLTISEFIECLGGSPATSENGAKRSRNRTSRTVAAASKS